MDLKLKDGFGYEKVEKFNDTATKELSQHYKEIIKLIGENTLREGLEKTPERVGQAIQFLMHGYSLDPKEILKSAMFREDYQQSQE